MLIFRSFSGPCVNKNAKLDIPLACFFPTFYTRIVFFSLSASPAATRLLICLCFFCVFASPLDQGVARIRAKVWNAFRRCKQNTERRCRLIGANKFKTRMERASIFDGFSTNSIWRLICRRAEMPPHQIASLNDGRAISPVCSLGV